MLELGPFDPETGAHGIQPSYRQVSSRVACSIINAEQKEQP